MMQEVRARVIEHGKFKIVIMAAPTDANSSAYVKELKALGVTDVVRTCESTYSHEPFETEGIRVHEMVFPDGAAPPNDLVGRWRQLIGERYKSKSNPGLVAVHCVAGLGRAPVMAAVALIEMTGVDPMDAVEKIREQQKGALNMMQLQYLQSYKRTKACGCVLL
eukprot:NODE_18964_length_866_cov_3.205683.p2 GENE.NODE_18964_length_866_cov_3.205683~~NODE_18964_length_866_cov_3.205683.p2  ORF type:complete len:164 (-),score=31.62 NODE_18964_length_866_cov_3.205683:244-735(-)